jgi:hypothetical protein
MERAADLRAPLKVEAATGTNWDEVLLIGALNMSTGLALEETLESIVDPSSIIGVLFTPSWDKTAVEDIVSDSLLKRLQTSGSVQAFQAGAKYEGLKEDFGEAPLMNSMQFDAVFEDGCAVETRQSRPGHLHRPGP